MSCSIPNVPSVVFSNPRLLRYMRDVARLRGVAPHDVDDVVQMAYLDAIADPELSRDPQAARRILGRIVRCRAIDYLRRRGIERARRRPTPAPEERPSYSGRMSLPDGGIHDPASCLVAGRVVAWIRRTFSPRHVGWLEDHARGETTDQIALRAGASPSYVRWRIRKLREALAKALGLERP